MMKKSLLACILSLVLSACSNNISVEPRTAEEPTVQNRVEPKIQALKGKVKGYDMAEHTIRVTKGERLKITLTSKNRFVYFNVLPESNDDAIFIGVENGDKYEGIVAETGEYKVKVYLVRAVARHNQTANYQLQISQQ